MISSDTGAISFGNEDLITSGFFSIAQGIKHNHGDSAYSYSKPFSNYTAITAAIGTLVIDLPFAFNNTLVGIKIRGISYQDGAGPWEVFVFGKPYNGVPDRWLYPRAIVSGKVPFDMVRVGYNGNTGKACIMLGETSTEWGHSIVEVSDVLVATAIVDGWETGWDINYYTDETNFYNNDADQRDPITLDWHRDFEAPSAVSQILQATADKEAAWTTDLAGLTSLTVDNITINGAMISSNTGVISFSNENLITSGMIETKNPTGGIFQATRDDSGIDTPDLIGSYQYYTNDASTNAEGVTCALRYICDGTWNGATNEGHWGIFVQDRTSVVSTLVERFRVNNTGEVEVVLGDLIVTDGKLRVENITINGAMISSDTGAISFSDENLSTTGTVVGSNIPSPTADDQALSSSASGVASWNVTCLADVLAQEVPSASGAERKFVLTADPGDKFEIEIAPWPITLTSNETVYVRTTGNDTTGDGSVSFPFLTVGRAIEFIGGMYIGDYVVTVDIGEGSFAEGTITFQHPFGKQVTFKGVSEQITNQDTTTIGSIGTSLGFSSLYRYDVTLVLPEGKSVSVGDYIAIREVTAGTNKEALYGCHYVSDWVSETRTATIQIVYRNTGPKASGTVTGMTIELIKTILTFDNQNGLKTVGPYHAGNWRGLVVEGNYDTTNTNAKYGVWNTSGSVITIGALDTDGNAIGVVGFQTGLLAQNNGLVFADYSFVSKCGTRCSSSMNGAVLSVRWARLSGASINCVYTTIGSAVDARGVKAVSSGDDTVTSLKGSFVDASVSAYVDQNVATNAFYADFWAGIDASTATYSDAVDPATGGNNDGSYVIV